MWGSQHPSSNQLGPASAPNNLLHVDLAVGRRGLLVPAVNSRMRLLRAAFVFRSYRSPDTVNQSDARAHVVLGNTHGDTGAAPAGSADLVTPSQ